MSAKINMLSESVVCPLCGHSDSKSCLEGRRDYEYGVSSTLNYASCQNPKCGLVFAVEVPSLDVVQGFYAKYSTHSHYQPSKLALVINNFSTKIRADYLNSIFLGRDLQYIKVLDYGCGAGGFLQQLNKQGVGEVVGYDFDSEACRCARDLGLTVYSEEEAIKANGPYDFIFLNHVIEHLVEPEATISSLLKLLRHGGRLVVRTPNASSFLAKLFGNGWRGWETPRHLHIFNTKAIDGLVAKVGSQGLSMVNLATSNAMYIGMFHESFHSDFWKKRTLGKFLRHAACFLLLPISLLVNAIRHDIGEEIVLVLEYSERN